MEDSVKSAERSKPLFSVHRNSISIAAAMLDGLCQGLLSTAQVQQEVSDVSQKLFNSIYMQVQGLMSETGAELWPEPTGKETLGDLIVMAMSLRGLYSTFLSPEQVEESEQKVSPFRMAEFARQKK